MADFLELLTDPPGTDAHFVQLYSDAYALADRVGLYMATGIRAGDSGLIIATRLHEAAFRQAIQNLGIDVESAERDGNLLFLDAEQTLNRFMVDGRPDWSRFDKTISKAVGSLRCPESRRIRAFGEMVGILWTQGQYSAATRIEEFWNRILASMRASLFCAYPVDVFGPEFDPRGLYAILCDHTHLLPIDSDESLAGCLNRAVDEVLGEKDINLNSKLQSGRPKAWGAVPAAEGIILWLREHVPERALKILNLARIPERAEVWIDVLNPTVITVTISMGLSGIGY